MKSRERLGEWWPARRRPISEIDLQSGGLYYAPSGRMCKLLPKPERGPGSGGDRYTFVYLDGKPDGERDSFTLTGANIKLLRAVG